jgi:hypothetical protein
VRYGEGEQPRGKSAGQLFRRQHRHGLVLESSNGLSRNGRDEQGYLSKSNYASHDAVRAS